MKDNVIEQATMLEKLMWTVGRKNTKGAIWPQSLGGNAQVIWAHLISAASALEGLTPAGPVSSGTRRAQGLQFCWFTGRDQLPQASPGHTSEIRRGRPSGRGSSLRSQAALFPGKLYRLFQADRYQAKCCSCPVTSH